MRKRRQAYEEFFFVLFISSAVLVYAPVFCAEELTVEKLIDAGVKHFYSQEFDKAIECYEKALAKAPDDKEKASLFFNLSSAYLEKGIPVYWEKKDDSFYKKSLEYSRKCLDIIPNYWRALGDMATVYMNMNELEKADFYYSEAEKYVDKNSPYYQQLFDQHSMVLGVLKLKEMHKDNKEK